MSITLNRPTRVLQGAAAVLTLVALGSAARADIFQWEYVNPANPGQGRRQSTRLAPDGAGVDAVPGADLSNRNLTMAYLVGADLSSYLDDFTYYTTDLTSANLSQADLTSANFTRAMLTGANLTGAEVRQANFSYDSENGLGTGITTAQLYSTASYQAHDLSGIRVQQNDLSGTNLAGKNLTGADFTAAMLADADFTSTVVRGVRFDKSLSEIQYDLLVGTGITPAQLYSTASYQAHDLSGISVRLNDLEGANFSMQNLTSANFDAARLIGANFSQSNLTNASFDGTALSGADFTGANIGGAAFYADLFSPPRIWVGGITLAQLYATASYQAHDLSGIRLSGDFAGGNFAGQNLTNAFLNADTQNADFTGADARGANLNGKLPHASNFIRPDGHINGLNLDAGALLLIRDYDGNVRFTPPTPPIPITVDQHLTIGADGTLRIVLEADAWDSAISFTPGIPVTLGGTLELAFADDVNLASQVGRTIGLFDWTGVTPTGAFNISSPYAWDFTNLYTTGEVTLTAVPNGPGDFNNDGTVDAADYVIWRKNPGGTYTPADYTTWRANVGRTAGRGAGASANDAVPEPATLVLLVFAATGWSLRRQGAA